MTAIVSKEFRMNSTKRFIEDVADNSSYYIFIGRSEPWDDDVLPDVPYDNYYSTYYEAYQRMTALKQLTAGDIAHSAIRYQWISGTTYSEYDDRDPDLDSKQFYVITDNNNVYVCLKSGGISTRNPDVIGVQTSGVIDFTAEDGYIWKYLFTLATDDAIKFLTSAFIPVRYLTEDPGVSADTALRNQWDVQNNAVPGTIYRIKVTSGGTGYTQAPTVVISGNGSGATATAVVSGGLVTEVVVTDPGSGYDQVSIEFTGGNGSGATAYAVLPPPGGFGADPRNDMRAHFAVINKRLINDDGQGDFIVGNDFRQIGIVRNPYNYGTTTVATGETLSATKSMEVGLGGLFLADAVIEGTVTGARAIVDSYDSQNGIIRYHQSEETGFEDFTVLDSVRNFGDPGIGQQVVALVDPEVQPYSGEIVFLENRTPINRSGDQIETIKLVLEF